jgi:hypothetical protein
LQQCKAFSLSVFLVIRNTEWLCTELQ